MPDKLLHVLDVDVVDVATCAGAEDGNERGAEFLMELVLQVKRIISRVLGTTDGIQVHGEAGQRSERLVCTGVLEEEQTDVGINRPRYADDVRVVAPRIEPHRSIFHVK